MPKNLKLKFFLFALISLGILFFISIQFPQLYLKKSFSYSQFDVYSNAELLKTKALVETLDSVINNIERSDFYNEEQRFKLFFVGGSFYSKVILFFGMNNIASSKFDTHIYNGQPSFETGWLVNGSTEFDRVNLVQIISHEAVHSQMYPEFSTLGFMDTEAWINEGYCEYISYFPKRKSDQKPICALLNTLEQKEEQWLLTPYKNYSPRFYLKSRMLVEYLIDKDQMSIRNIIEKSPLNTDSIYNEIKLWCSNQEHF